VDVCARDLDLDISTVKQDRGHHKVPIGMPDSTAKEKKHSTSVDIPESPGEENSLKANSANLHTGTLKNGLVALGIFVLFVAGALFAYIAKRRKRTQLHLADFSDLRLDESNRSVEMTDTGRMSVMD